MAELDDERGKYGSGVLLSLVLEIEEKEGYMSRSCVADGLNILDNGRANGLSIMKAIISLGRKTRT
jgi:hypothetical protein